MSRQNLVHWLLAVAATVAVGWVVVLSIRAILLLIAAIILATALRGASARLARYLPGSERTALLTVIVALGGGFLTLLVQMGPRIGASIAELKASLEGAYQDITSNDFFIRLVGDVHQQQSNGGGPLGDEMVSIITRLTTLAGNIFETLSGLLLVFALTLFLAWDPELYRRGLLSLFPRRMRQEGLAILDKLGSALWHWIVAQAIAMLIIGALTAAGLYFVGMEFAMMLGLVAGLLQFIPYIGPFLSAIPGIVLALAESPHMALMVAAVYVGVQIVEGNFITPAVAKQEASLPPVLTLFATVAMGLVFGPLGLIIATPFSLILLVLYRELYPVVILREASEIKPVTASATDPRLDPRVIAP